MVFKNGVKNIQAAANNSAHTVDIFCSLLDCFLFFQQLSPAPLNFLKGNFFAPLKSKKILKEFPGR